MTTSEPTRPARRPTSSVLVEFSVASERGNARRVVERVGEVCADLGLSPARLDAIETAVAEATLNAMEHGNGDDASLPVEIGVYLRERSLVVRVTDQGRGGGPPGDAEEPDIEAKLRGEQSPRGWGLFLIRNLVDEVHVSADDAHHLVELVVRLDGDEGHGVRPASDRS